MEVKKLLIIPDKDDLEIYEDLAEKYDVGFEFNDFFLPMILEDEGKVCDIVQRYKLSDGLPDYCTSHGAFLDVTVFSDDIRIVEVSNYRVEQSLKIATELGVKGVVFHTNYIANFVQKSYCDSWVERNFIYWSKKLEKYSNLDIYIENMFDIEPFLLEKLAKKLSIYKNFGVCFDYAHAHVFGDKNKVDEWVKSLHPYVKHIHINDNDFKEDLHLPLGEGCINWDIFKKYYEQYFSEASVLLELRGYQNIKKSIEFLKSL